MNNISDELPFLAASAPEIFSQIASPPSPSTTIFGPGFPEDQNPRRNCSKLRIGPKLGAIAKPKLRIKKPDYGGSGGAKVCSECGKKFWSWKALFGHMRCHPERQWRGMNPPSNFHPGGAPPLPDPEPDPWLTMTEEDHEVAECLLMLANGVPPQNPPRPEPSPDHVQGEVVFEAGSMGQFECSSCKKVFGSHQALGGHRASHKNVKGCFALMSSSSGGGNTELMRESCGDQSGPPFTHLVMNSFATKNVSGTDLNLDLRLGL